MAIRVQHVMVCTVQKTRRNGALLQEETPTFGNTHEQHLGHNHSRGRAFFSCTLLLQQPQKQKPRPAPTELLLSSLELLALDRPGEEC